MKVGGTGQDCFIDFGDADDADAGFIRYNHGNNFLAITTNAAERMRVNSSGEVGIGVTSPDSKLALAGTGSDAATRISITDGSGKANVLGRYGNLSLQADEGNAVAGSLMQFKVDGSEKMRILSGGGITFNGDTAQANALNDYEEGTWTPDLRFGNGSSGMSYSTQIGTYTKVGNVVHWRFRISLSNKGSSTGHAQVFGLPFVCSANNQGEYGGGYVCYAAGLTNSSRWSANQTPTIDTNNTYVFLRYVITGIDYSSNHNNASMTNSTDLILAGHYVTNS